MMTATEKLIVLKTILDVTDNSIDTELNTYLFLAEKEILNWMYQRRVPEGVTAIPECYEVTQIYAVVNGYNKKGAEGESVHNENGINRTFSTADMLEYIHSNVYQRIRL